MSEDRFSLDRFKHHTTIRVRNYEVDWQGIVHNAVYLQYFEVGRVEYLRHIGSALELGNVNEEKKVVLVRNEVDYKMPVSFDTVLEVHTRISKIGTTSFWMEGVLVDQATHSVVGTNVAYHVWLDPSTNKPRDVGDDFRKLIDRFEGQECVIHWPSRTA